MRAAQTSTPTQPPSPDGFGIVFTHPNELGWVRFTSSAAAGVALDWSRDKTLAPPEAVTACPLGVKDVDVLIAWLQAHRDKVK